MAPPQEALIGLQRAAGNAAVQRLVRQRQPASPCPPPVSSPQKRAPGDDPRFVEVTSDVAAAGRRASQHRPATAEANDAQKAATPPPNSRDAAAKAAQASTMAAAQPQSFDKAAFIAAVEAAIAAQTPSNLDEAERFADSGRADSIKAAVSTKVTAGSAASARDIATKTAQAPDASKAPAKLVTPLRPRRSVPSPRPPPAMKAVPARRPQQQTQLGAQSCEVQSAMADAGVTEAQLEGSNEPQFVGALEAKKAGQQHDRTAATDVRAAEAQTLDQARAGAQAAGATAVESMMGQRSATETQVSAAQAATTVKDEAKRAQVAAAIQKTFDSTKADVQAILDGLDAKVGARFDVGEASARAAFTADHRRRMAAYKQRRYRGVDGAARWIRDKFMGLPPEASQIYQASRRLYVSRMRAVISSVADVIGSELDRARRRIASGRAQISSYVASLPSGLRQVGAQAAADIHGRFSQLEQSVDSKSTALVDDLARRYVEARDAVDAEIGRMQAENRGLWDRAMDAVGEVIETIKKVKEMLAGALSSAAGAISTIIQDPIGFLGNLISAIKSGVASFAANIAQHLKKGLLAWLFGALAAAGIELPSSFNIRGILSLVLGVMGATWTAIRGRLVRRVGQRVVATMEQTVSIVRTLVTEGLPGLWRTIAGAVGNLTQMIVAPIRQFVIEKVIKAGIVWLVSMLNPAAAFIKAAKAIVDIVVFFVTQAAQIAEFVQAVIGSITAIAGGAIGAATTRIEQALAKSVPVVIGLLASILGLGGMSAKIRSVIRAVQRPVKRAIDRIVNGILRLGRRLLNRLRRRGGSRREAGHEAAGRTSTASVKREARRQLQPGLSRVTSPEQVRSVLGRVMGALRSQGLRRLSVRPTRTEGRYSVHAVASPSTKVGEFTPSLALDLRDIDLTARRNQYVTVAKGSIDGRDLGTGRNSTPVAADETLETFEQQGRHAEAVVIDRLHNMVVLDRYPRTGTHRFELHVTRTPCNDCTDKIARVKRLFAEGGGNLDVVVRSLALYQGTRDRARHDATGRGTRAGGVYSLVRLRGMDVKVEAWDLTRDAERLFGPDVDRAQLEAVAGRVSGKVRELSAVLKAMAPIDAA